MSELNFLCKRFGWQGGTIHDAREEARRRGWKPFNVDVMTIPPLYEMQLTGEQIVRRTLTLWGKTRKEAISASGIE